MLVWKRTKNLTKWMIVIINVNRKCESMWPKIHFFSIFKILDSSIPWILTQFFSSFSQTALNTEKNRTPGYHRDFLYPLTDLIEYFWKKNGFICIFSHFPINLFPKKRKTKLRAKKRFEVNFPQILKVKIVFFARILQLTSLLKIRMWRLNYFFPCWTMGAK